MANYLANSPYYTTLSTNGYLDVWNYRDIPSQTDDISYTVTKDYEYRPDLLAYDLYRDAGLWWVFAARNPSIIQDPMFDLVAGLVIRLPKLSTIKKSLGI
jgi:hypothetical protein